MDGNRRWAIKNSRNLLEGYEKGSQVAEKVVSFAIREKIPHLTLYAFSAENLNRPKDQVEFILNKFEEYLINKHEKLKKKGARIRVVGDITSMPSSLRQAIDLASSPPSCAPKLNLYIAFNYGGKQEILRACKLATLALKDGEEITKDKIEEHLYAPEMPDLDLVIRTGGVSRISNFLLWKIAYSELYFLDTLWPEVKIEHLLAAISKFKNSKRTLGTMLNEKVAA